MTDTWSLSPSSQNTNAHAGEDNSNIHKHVQKMGIISWCLLSGEGAEGGHLLKDTDLYQDGPAPRPTLLSLQYATELWSGP